MQVLNGYYVKRLEENPVNHFKWIYIDSYDGELKENDNKWYFDLKFYIIQNLNLPLNVFNLTLSTQFCEITDLTINPSNIEQIPQWVQQKEYCTAYSLSFNLDTNDSKFFQQALEKYNIQLQFKMGVDTNVLNNAKVELDQDEYDQFVTECYSQQISATFKYSNYEQKDDSNSFFEMPSTYYLNSSIGSYSEDEVVYYSLNNETEQTDEPIKKLVDIEFKKEFTIFEQKIKFVYQILGQKQQEISYETSLPTYGNTPTIINYDFCTYYNESTGTIENQINGVDGFYCPLTCVGYYEIGIKVNFNNTTKIIKFINNFSFKGNEDYQKNKLVIMQVFIDDLTYFKEVSF